MKLRTGQCEYKIPAIGKIDHAFIAGNTRQNNMVDIMLYQISLKESARLDYTAFQGIPANFAINPIKKTIKFWPPPNKPYTVCIRYTPPMQEF